jgi:hypothetical protein
VTRRCSRCGEGFTVDVPSKGRRLCEVCRAKRATFFTCPGCGAEREVKSATRDAERRPVQCWDCRHAALHAAHTEAVVAHVSALDPALSHAVIGTAIEVAAPSRDERKWLAVHLEVHPDALTSGSAQAPRVVCRLAAALESAGASTSLPRCGRCGAAALLVRATEEHGRICEDCDANGRAEPCSVCERVRRVSTRTTQGKALCNPCRLRDPATWEICSLCERRRRVNTRNADGSPICPSCYEAPCDSCTKCGAVVPITYRRDGIALCAPCYRRHQAPRRPCGRCGRLKIINRRARDGEPDLCNGCYWAVVAICTRCGEMAPGRGVKVGTHVCLRCIARQRLDELLTAADGTIPEAFGGLREAFFAAEQPRSVFLWLDRSPGALLLRRLVTGGLALSHEALDEQAQTPSLRHLRQLLVATGALPERDPHVAALERFIRATADSLVHPDDARLLRSFGTWRILARLRRRPGGPTVLAVKNAKATFSQGAAFLRWLHDQQLSLSECGATDLDRWLAPGTRARVGARPLLVWAAERGVTDLEPPKHERRAAPAANDGEARWEHARRLLHDDAVDAADRVVGSLVVLYAQPLTRIAKLRLDDVVELDGDVHVSFGKDLVFMPEPLAAFLRQLPWRRQVGPSGHAPGAAQWLFPGRQAGQHQHPDYLANRLRALGISPRKSRTDALIHFGASLPAKVLADLLNLHPNTAVRWVKAAGGDWANYAATRLRSETQR